MTKRTVVHKTMSRGAFLQRLVEHRKIMTPAAHLTMMADIHWNPRGLKQEYLDTNCEITAQAARELFDCEWEYKDILGPDDNTFVVVFDEGDHYMFVHEGRVYQSYAFACGVTESEYNPNRPFWAHVVHDAEQYENNDVEFIVPVQQ